MTSRATIQGGAAALILGLIATERSGAQEGSPAHPVYIGVQACTRCHEGPAMGHQFSIWRLSAHARAYTALAMPEARRIAKLSGLTGEPQKEKVCLGCHATAADVEKWERDEGFRIEDGLQCEKCHGPGSEYADRDIMLNRRLAVQKGLKIPGKESCMICHRVRGSHEAVLKKEPYDLERAWKTIAHLIPVEEDPRLREQHDLAPAPRGESSGRFRYAGTASCTACHRGRRMGFQFSRWRRGPHARAYADLATARAGQIAREMKVKGVPQRSPACLKCHTTGQGYDAASFLAGFDPREGVGCESCHGPGSAYSAEAVMLDPIAARDSGLLAITPATCAPCHEKAHGKPFDYEQAAAAIAHPTKVSEEAAAPRYKTPLHLALGAGDRELWVTCEAAGTVILIDTATRRKVAEIPTGGQPTGIAFHPDGSRAYVTNRLDDSLAVIDVKKRAVVRTVAVGDEPHGVLVDPTGRYIYVLDSSIDAISVLDATTLAEVKRLVASRSPWDLALAPNGRSILVTNTLPRFVEPRTPDISEVTVIDTERAVVTDRIALPAANLLQGVAWHPSGEYALVTLTRTKNLVPMVRLLQGWTITNGLGVIWARDSAARKAGEVDQVLLDEPDLAFPDPAGVAITPDGHHALVTSSGSNRIAVVDLRRLVAMLKEASAYERRRVFPNHLGKPVEFIQGFIPSGGDSPRGILCAADGRTAYVANALDDSIAVLDLERMAAAGKIDLGGPELITKARLGEKVFHSAQITFRRQFSCHTCHPDGHVNGTTFDIEPDGIGVSPVDNRTLRGILDTAPFKWEGTNPTLQRQCGPRLSVFFTRLQPFNPVQLSALEYYICTIPRPPNRYRALGARLTPPQRRGKAVFERARGNDGQLLPPEQRCINCHPPPLYTDGRRHDIGTRGPLDREGRFDSPHLSNIYDSAPYLHDGRAQSLEEIWTRFNPHDQHGRTNDLTKDQLNDLIEYIKTL